ncbi:MAG: NAD-dependent epimerase/dehydratase family protein [Sulfitobacter sp.]
MSAEHSPKRVLITGASGFLGRQLMAHYAQDDAIVPIAGSRGGTSPVQGCEALAYGDLTDAPDLLDALKDVSCIVHCAGRAHVLHEENNDPLPLFMAANCDATLSLARQAAAAGVKRFVFLSSIGVNGNQTFGTPFRSTDAPKPHAPYAVSKRAAEEGLLALSAETGLEVVIIRPPLILGPDPVGNLATLAKLIGKGIPLPFGAATQNRRSLVTGRTVASLIRTCMDHPSAPGQVFLVANTPPLSLRGILTQLSRETNQSMRLIPVPVGLLRAGLRLLGRGAMDAQLFGDLEIDIAATTTTLGWTPEPFS